MCQFLRKLVIDQPKDPSTPLLGIFLKDASSIPQRLLSLSFTPLVTERGEGGQRRKEGALLNESRKGLRVQL